MRELLLVGRGGEGVVLASQILAETFARAGSYVQAFPEFTAERRGAPISAFLRFDDEPIHRRYKVRACDVLAVVTPSPPAPTVLGKVRPGGLVVVNREERFPLGGPFHVARVPASAIAREQGILSAEGRPMGNVALLGAVVRLLAPDALTHLVDAVEVRLGAVNAEAARAGYERCVRQRARAGDPPVEVPPSPRAAARPRFAMTSRTSLANATGSWSLERPVLMPACNDCALCALFCPEGAITRTDGVVAIDYLHCKGCGICSVVCPVRDAIGMEAVPA